MRDVDPTAVPTAATSSPPAAGTGEINEEKGLEQVGQGIQVSKDDQVVAWHSKFGTVIVPKSFLSRDEAAETLNLASKQVTKTAPKTAAKKQAVAGQVEAKQKNEKGTIKEAVEQATAVGAVVKRPESSMRIVVLFGCVLLLCAFGMPLSAFGLKGATSSFAALAEQVSMPNNMGIGAEVSIGNPMGPPSSALSETRQPVHFAVPPQFLPMLLAQGPPCSGNVMVPG